MTKTIFAILVICIFGYSFAIDNSTDKVSHGLFKIASTSSNGENPDDLKVICEMFFSLNPSHFYYEVKAKEKKIIFEFWDVQKDTSIDSAILQPPFLGYSIEELKLERDGGKIVTTQTLHDVTKVTFSLSHVPKVQITDKGSSVRISYCWPTDSNRIKDYVLKRDYTGKDGFMNALSMTVKLTLFACLIYFLITTTI